MFRIDDPSAASQMPTPEAAGTPGFWTEGNPTTGVPATLERASWFNSIQEELMSILTAGGVTPSKTTYNQVLTALQALYGPGRAGHVFTGNDWVPLPGGLILQWGTGSASSTSSGNLITFPVTFPTACLQAVATDSGNQDYAYGCGNLSKTGFSLTGGSTGGSSYSTGVARYFAIGF
jgi:hypothetical protein